MNVLFWSLMLLMLLVAIGLTVFPLLRARGFNAIAYKDSNLNLYEEKLAELDIDLAEARIDQEHYRAARQEMDRELLDNVPAETTATAAEHYVVQHKKHPALALVFAVFVPAFALLLYQQLGMHGASQLGEPAAQQAPLPSIEEMTAKLETFLQENAGGVQEWRMLGRAYKQLGRFDDSITAFGRALDIQPDAQLMLEKAEAMALRNDQVFDKEARDLVMQAKTLEPDNINVLWFAGVAEFQQGAYRASIDNLSRLATVAKSDPDVNQSIRFYIEKARAELITKGEAVASVDQLLQVEAAATTTDKVAAPVVSLRIAVSVSADARAKFSAEDTVFIYAKATQGPKMPLAVQRLTLSALPTEVTLDDSMAMVAGMNLSAFSSVVVAARISRSGSAIAQSGDYIGEYQVNEVNSAKDIISIHIDRVVP